MRSDVLDPDAAIMRGHGQLAEGEAESHGVMPAPRAHSLRRIPLEDALVFRGGNARAVVLHCEPHALSGARDRDDDVTVRCRVPDRIADEILNDAAEKLDVAFAHHRAACTDLDVT